MAKSKKRGLTKKNEDELIQTLNDFAGWLVKKKIAKNLSNIDHTVEMPFANEDWTMKVDEKNKNVSFNTFLVEKSSFKYYKMVIVHEFFHLAVQRVPNKEDSTRIKDDFGEELMKLIDIEADFFTALYFKEKLGYGLIDYLKLYYEGSRVFYDRRIRGVKLERFIGSLLSITKMFLIPVSKKEDVAWDLYLPTINPVYTEESLHVLVIRREHIYLDEIKASYQDFVDIKKCYINIDKLSVKGYVDELIKFSCRALKIEVPEKVQNEINLL